MTDTDGTGATATGFCVAQRNETEFLRVLLVDMVLPLEVLYNMLLRLLDELADMGTGTLMESSKSNLSKLFVWSKENPLKRGYFSGYLTAALANILRKNLLGSPLAIC